MYNTQNSVKAFKSLLVFSALFISPAFSQDQSAQVKQGAGHYAEVCALCHGADGKKGDGFQTPIWGAGTMIGSKFGNAQALLDYMALMPFNDPSLLNDPQKLAVVAFMLSQHGAIKANEEVDLSKLKAIPIK